MSVEHEPLDEFELELKQALQRRPAPPSLKRRLLARRDPGVRPQIVRGPSILWQRLAASVVLIAALGGGFAWWQREQEQRKEEQRKGEEARQQVLTALRITSHALDHVQAQLAAHDRGSRTSPQ
jgi:hypothetical protein